MLPLELTNRNTPEFAHILGICLWPVCTESGSHFGNHRAVTLTLTAVIMGSFLTPDTGINVLRLFSKKYR